MIKGKCKIHYFKEVPNTPQTYRRQDGSIIVMLRANTLPSGSCDVFINIPTGIHSTIGTTVWGRRSAVVRQS